MATKLLEVDGAQLTRFGGGSSNFASYRGPAYQIDDERNRFVALTPVQALRLAHQIIVDQNPTQGKVTDDDLAESAFPTDRDGVRGMDLRDYFAARFIDSCRAITDNVDEAARAAYAFADTMLVARKAVVRG